MIDKVKVVATYDRPSQVPSIGQRKKMRVNGKAQLLTLNSLTVEREAVWDEVRDYFDYQFNTQEEWGEFFI